jgi:hypothetical protein
MCLAPCERWKTPPQFDSEVCAKADRLGEYTVLENSFISRPPDQAERLSVVQPKAISIRAKGLRSPMLSIGQFWRLTAATRSFRLDPVS